MRQYRKNAQNLKRERKLERERYHQKHPDTTHPPDVGIEIHAPNRVPPPIPPRPHPPPRPPRPYPYRPPIEDEEEVEIEIEEHPVRYKDNAEKCRAYAKRKRNQIGEEEFLKHQRERKAKWRKKTGRN